MDDFLERPLCFLDLESTGTNIASDRICEIALIKLFEGKILEELHHYIDPEIPIPEAATAIHGLKRNEGTLKEAKTFADLAQEIFHFIKGCDIAGHSIMQFDLPLLVEEFLRAGISSFPVTGTQFVDTLFNQAKIAPRTLEGVWNFYMSAPFDRSQAHGATYDARASMEIYKAQIELHGPQLGQTREDLHNIATKNKLIVDFAGKLTLNKDKMIVYAFGKNEGVRVTNDTNYLAWMLKNDFTADTKKWLNLCIKFQDDYFRILKGY